MGTSTKAVGAGSNTMSHQCDKCGADVCVHCEKVCNETCDKARIDRLEREIKELKARPAAIQFIPLAQPYPVYTRPQWTQPYQPYYHPWTITCGAFGDGSIGAIGNGALLGNFNQ